MMMRNFMRTSLARMSCRPSHAPLPPRDRALDAGNQQQVEGNEGVFQTDCDQAAPTTQRQVFGMAHVICAAVGDEYAEWFEWSSGQEPLNLLRGHGRGL
jgi:hypothetical protein